MILRPLEGAIRNTVVILGEIENTNYAEYVHDKLRKDTFTFLTGHDSEGYRYLVDEEQVPASLNLHKNSSGYRLILNNILFPAKRNEV